MRRQLEALSVLCRYALAEPDKALANVVIGRVIEQLEAMMKPPGVIHYRGDSADYDRVQREAERREETVRD